MQLRFNVSREKQNKIAVTNYTNDHCLLQFHSQVEIYLVDEGEMEMLVNGKSKVLKAGEFSVALSYEAHSYKTPKTSKSSLLQVPANLCEEYINLIKGKRLVSPFFSDPKMYAQIKANHEALMEEGISHLRQLGYIYVILGMILEHGEFEEADKPINLDLATKILFYINENYKNDISVGSIAAHFGYNQSYVSRYFKTCCSIPLVEYLTAVRLKNAILLMHENKHDITYCAMESGFSSMRTFYRAFQKEFHCTPREYKLKSK